MRRSSTTLKVFGFVVIIMAAACLTQAQAPRTWVSGTGDDANPCSRTAPCKTFAGAISKTQTNGEMNCLDPAGYGGVTITKSITIDCEDTQGSVLAAAGQNGIVINITAAADTKKSVKIRGISMNGQALSNTAIRVLAANQVVIEEVVIDGFTQHGISFENTTGTTKALIDSTGIRSNGGNGINTSINGGNLTLAVRNSRIEMNAIGINLSNGTKATLTDSVVMGNTTGVASVNSDIAVSYTDISLNTTGLLAGTGSTIRIAGNTITSNGTGLSTAGGSIISFSTNMRQGNTADGAPSLTIVLQ